MLFSLREKKVIYFSSSNVSHWQELIDKEKSLYYVDVCRLVYSSIFPVFNCIQVCWPIYVELCW